MATKRQKYKEGDWFAVPLSDGRYAVGLIARMGPKKKVLLGYFFDLIFEEVPELKTLEKLKASEAILIKRFGDLGLLRGYWPVIGTSEQWDREKWPSPLFVSEITGVEEMTGHRAWYVRRYADDDPTIKAFTKVVGELPAEDYVEDGLAGYKSIEIRLSRLLIGDNSSEE